ncbi:hypothetical protein ABT112_17295 [Streptomyces sp. NPDC002055]|uniref:hypothetical protein n=1 Tax=Streptomyces sp. NPDC002055 TaxID=3154534 RepID=UPI00333497B2
MGGVRVLAWALVFWLASPALAGCRPLPVAGGGPEREQERSAAPVPAGHGGTFLDRGECSARGRTGVREVPCGSARAVARVLTRRPDGPADAGPRCPARTDFVLRVSARLPDRDENGDGSVAQGYACMRRLTGPHPGDPGGGGGPRTLVGDCVTVQQHLRGGRSRVVETACEGPGPEPRYRVTAAVRDGSACPPATALRVRLGGGTPVGCARRL